MALKFQIVKPEKTHVESLAYMWCRSIRELCCQDHHGDPEIIKNWLANKTPESLMGAIADSSLIWNLALMDGQVVGVCMFGFDGILRALYVHPEFVGKHVGAYLLDYIETVAIDNGIREITLESTKTAQQFYLHHGYRLSGGPVECFGVTAYPMKKVFIDTYSNLCSSRW